MYYEDYICQDDVAPRTKLNVPTDDFPIHLIFWDVQRQTKTSLDVLQRVTIGDYWNMDGDRSLFEPWTGMTPFALLDRISPEDILGIKATDEETGHNKTKEHLARRMCKYVKKHSVET